MQNWGNVVEYKQFIFPWKYIDFTIDLYFWPESKCISGTNQRNIQFAQEEKAESEYKWINLQYQTILEDIVAF
jgi:hypothetical protein